MYSDSLSSPATIIFSTFRKKIKNLVPNEYFLDNDLYDSGRLFDYISYIKTNYSSYCLSAHRNSSLIGEFLPEDRIPEEILVWCETNFGNNWIWNFSTIYFKYEQDRSFFVLKWS